MLLPKLRENAMREAWIIDGVRTPRGKGKPTGSLHGVHPQELLAVVLRALADRGLQTGDVDDVVMGNGEQAGEHANDIARSAVLTAGWPYTVPGLTINRFCGGGQQAVMAAATGVLAGWQDLVVAGGVESMSRHSYGQPLDAGNPKLRQRYPLVPQGIAADLIATLEGFDRHAVDCFAATSQDRAATAMKEDRFRRSIVPVSDEDGDVLLDRDEHPRPGTTVESLVGLPASFERSGAKARADGRSYDDMCRETYPDAGPIQHVHHAGPGSSSMPGQGGDDRIRRRPVGNQRSLRSDTPESDPRSRPRPGQGQRQRWRDRAGTSDRSHRSDALSDHHRRAGAPGPHQRAGRDVHRRRDGNGDNRRTDLTALAPLPVKERHESCDSRASLPRARRRTTSEPSRGPQCLRRRARQRVASRADDSCTRYASAGGDVDLDRQALLGGRRHADHPGRAR